MARGRRVAPAPRQRGYAYDSADSRDCGPAQDAKHQSQAVTHTTDSNGSIGTEHGRMQAGGEGCGPTKASLTARAGPSRYTLCRFRPGLSHVKLFMPMEPIGRLG